MTTDDSPIGSAFPFNFNRSKPFYLLVLNYLILIHGYLDVASRVMIRQTRVTLTWDSPVPPILPAGSPISPQIIETFYSHPANRMATRQAMAPQLLATNRPKVTLDTDMLSDEYEMSYVGLQDWMMRSAGVLLVTAWESTNDMSTKSPIWEFLRHCRNAVAHDGTITLTNREPRRPAEWNGIAITKASQGTPLFAHGFTKGLLWPGDLLYLLWDLEQSIG